MKINIQKLQLGATVQYLSHPNPFSQAAVADRQAQGTTSSASADSGLISEKLRDKLIEKGIPTDVNKFMNMLADFEQRADFGLGVNKRDLYKLRAYANQVIKQSEYLNDAEKRADVNGALDEYAVDSKGFLFVRDKSKEGHITKVHASQFKYGEDLPITVGELLQLRKFDPDLVDDSSVATVIASNIGTEKINDYIFGIIKEVGSAENSSEAYVNLGQLLGRELAKKPTQRDQQTLQQLYGLVQQLGPEALFKIKEAEKGSNLDYAMKYIMSMLPSNIKTQLIARNVTSGGEYQDNSLYASKIIGNALLAADDYKISNGIDYESGLNKAAGTDKSSTKTFYQTPNEAFFDGDLNQLEVKLSDPSSNNKYGISLKGNIMPALTTDNGNAISNLPLGIALNETIGKYLDKNEIYMGQQKINEGMLNNIAYSNQQVAAVWMPVDRDGNIDWVGFKAYSQAEDEIKANKITDPMQKNQIHAAHHSYIMYDQNNNIIPTDNVARFAMTYGYTIDDYIDEDMNDLARELYGDEEKQADNLLDAIYNKAVNKKFGVDGIERKQTWDDIYQVPMFIKINDFASGDAYRYGGHGSNLKPKTLEEDMVQEKINQEPRQNIYSSGSILYQE